MTPADPGSAFWGVDSVAAAPVLNVSVLPGGPTYWLGACFIGPGEVPLLQAAVPTGRMQVWWAVPQSTTSLTADQVTALQARLNGVLTVGGIVQVNGQSVQVTLSSGLAGALSAFSGQDQAIGAVLSLLFVSLAVIGIVAVLLGAGLVATRRSAEFAVLRARGASLRQVAGRALAAAAVLALPAAAAGAVLAIAVTPGGSTAVAWWLAGCALAAALAGLPLFAAGQQRGTGGGRGGRGRSPGALTPCRVAPRRPGAWWPRRDWPRRRSAASSCSGGRACPRAASTCTRARRPCWWRSWPPSSSCTATRSCSGCCCGWPGPARGSAPSSGSRGPPGPLAAPSCRCSPWSWPWPWSRSAP